jgi:hypothetical protein
VVFDESVFPFSSPPITTPAPDPSSLFPTDPVVQPPFPWSPAGTASPTSLPGSCPRSPPGPGSSSSSAAPASPIGPDLEPSLPGAAPAPPLDVASALLRGSLRRSGCTSVVRGRRLPSRFPLRRGHRHHRRSPRRPVSHRRSTTRRCFTDTRGMFTRC